MIRKSLFTLAALSLAFGLGLAVQAQAQAPGAATAGFEEFPIGDDQTVGPLHVAGVYFQPVDMEPASAGGLPKAQADMHLEADISAAEGNNLGYGAGDFV
ncbi:MAG: iron transporter, partial [Deltaproteobacteria bacterium]|nr:iron transporter [Deltaproteobacteria bacterium]